MLMIGNRTSSAGPLIILIFSFVIYLFLVTIKKEKLSVKYILILVFSMIFINIFLYNAPIVKRDKYYNDLDNSVADVNKEDYIIFDNKDILLTICGYKDGDFNLNDYFDIIFKNIFEDKLIAVSGKEQCENCINYQNCEYSYKEE